MMDLLELAERCEKATGPDRELDAEIAVAANGHHLKPFTASFDAAMKLVPEGWEWLRKSPSTMSVYCRPSDEEWAKHVDGAGATPALALCAAALRARSGEQHND